MAFPADADGVARTYAVSGSLAAAAFDPPATTSGGIIRWQGGLEQIKVCGVPVLSAGSFIATGGPILQQLVAAALDLEPEQIARALAAEPARVGEVARLLRGRTVFIGANASGTFDLKPLPVGQIEPGLLLHWTAWTNLAAGGFIAAVPRGGIFLTALLVTGTVILTGHRGARLLAPVAVAVGLGLLLFAGDARGGHWADVARRRGGELLARTSAQAGDSGDVWRICGSGGRGSTGAKP